MYSIFFLDLSAASPFCYLALFSSHSLFSTVLYFILLCIYFSSVIFGRRFFPSFFDVMNVCLCVCVDAAMLFEAFVFMPPYIVCVCIVNCVCWWQVARVAGTCVPSRRPEQSFFSLFVCCSASNSKWIWYEFAYFSYTLRYTTRTSASTPPTLHAASIQTTLAHTYSLLVAYVTMNDAFGIMECNVDERPHRTRIHWFEWDRNSTKRSRSEAQMPEIKWNICPLIVVEYIISLVRTYVIPNLMYYSRRLYRIGIYLLLLRTTGRALFESFSCAKNSDFRDLYLGDVDPSK